MFTRPVVLWSFVISRNSEIELTAVLVEVTFGTEYCALMEREFLRRVVALFETIRAITASFATRRRPAVCRGTARQN